MHARRSDQPGASRWPRDFLRLSSERKARCTFLPQPEVPMDSARVNRLHQMALTLGLLAGCTASAGGGSGASGSGGPSGISSGGNKGTGGGSSTGGSGGSSSSGSGGSIGGGGGTGGTSGSTGTGGDD